MKFNRQLADKGGELTIELHAFFSEKSDEQSVGSGSVSAAHYFLSGALALFVDQPFADNRQA